MLVCTLLAALALQAPDATEVAKDFDIQFSNASTPIKSGVDSQLVITIVPKNSWIVKSTTPLNITLSATPAVKFTKTKLDTKDLLPEQKPPTETVGVTFSAPQKGAYTIHADMSFFLCTEQVCQRFTAKREHKIKVE